MKSTCVGVLSIISGSCLNATRVDWKVRLCNACLLLQKFFVQNNSSLEKRKQWPTFPQSHLEGSSICHMVSVNVIFSTEFWAWWMGTPWGSLLHFHNSLEYVTTKMLLQRTKKMKVTWCQDPTQPNRWQPCCSNLYGNVLIIHCTALTSHRMLLPEQTSQCRFQNVTDVQETASQWFHLQILEFLAEGINLLITHCDRCMNL